MKKLLVMLMSLAVSAVCLGSNLDDAIASNNWKKAAYWVCLTNTAPITANIVSNIYQEAKTNNWNDKTYVLAHVALKLGNKEIFKDWLNSVKMEYKNGNFINFGLYGLSALDKTNKETSVAWRYDSKSKRYIGVPLNHTHPELMLAFYKDRAQKKDMLAVVNAIHKCVNYSTFPHSLNPHVTSEWQKLLDDNITPDVFEAYPESAAILEFYNYLNITRSAEDVAAFITPKLIRAYAIGAKTIVKNSLYRRNKETMLEAFAQYSPILANRIQATKELDAINKNKNASNSIWSYVAQNGSWNEKVDFVVYLNNKDKIIDVFLTIGEDATPEQLNNMIVALNGLDREYRKAEVLSILKNVNSKYTLKLYNERETWEPIISKIRAMIDVRED